MIAPCHSNLFAIGQVEAPSSGPNLHIGYAKAADHSGIGYRVRTGGNGFRPWKRADGCTVENSETGAHGSTAFWLSPKSEAASITCASYTKDDGTVCWYINKIDGYETVRTGRRRESGYRLRIDAKCDRLLLVQNAVLHEASGDEGFSVDFSCGKQQWFAPRKGGNSCGISAANLNVRPFRNPASSVYGRDGIPWKSKDLGDWSGAYNPDWIPFRDWCHFPKPVYCPPDRLGDIDEAYREKGKLIGGWLGMNWICGGYDRRDLDHWFPDVSDFRMFYGVCYAKDSQGNLILDEHGEKKFEPLWWKECPASNPKTVPEGFSLDGVRRGLRGLFSYASPSALRNVPFLAMGRPDPNAPLADLVGLEKAFDLLLFCRTYHYFAKNLDTGDIHRGYFNTHCQMRVRQVAPVPPAGVN